jgi:hypothetical protein
MWNCMLTDGLVGTELSCMFRDGLVGTQRLEIRSCIFRDGLVGTQRLEVTLDCASGLRSGHHELSFIDDRIGVIPCQINTKK